MTWNLFRDQQDPYYMFVLKGLGLYIDEFCS
jgi:hypothetical protein